MNELTTQREMNPANWDMIRAISETVEPRAVTERAKIAKHLLFCFENDLPLSLAVNGGLYTVNGRVEVEGTVIRAQIRKHPDYDYHIEKLTDKECIITILGKTELLEYDENKNFVKKLDVVKMVEIGKASFTWDDVKAAGLQDKENYKKYPIDMLLNRATSRAYKRFCPDIFMQSVYVSGEMSNQSEVVTIDQDTGEISPTWESLIAKYDPDNVLEASSKTNGSIEEMVVYLEKNYEPKTELE